MTGGVGAPLDLPAVARSRGVPGSRPLVVAPAEGGTLSAFSLDDLDEAVDRRAGALKGSVRPGRVHPVTVEPGMESLLQLLALWRLGVTPAPLNPRLTEPERETARAALEGREGGGAQVVLWTSGSSGRPRGVLLDGSALVTHVDAVAERLELRPASDLWAATLSPAHVGGLMLVVRALLTGSAVLLPGPLDSPGLGDLLAGPVLAGAFRAPVTHLSLVPTQLRRLLEVPVGAPTDLRCILLGGAHTPRPLLERALRAGWPVALTWGMTEMASQVATAPPEEVRRKPGSPGRPLVGVRVRVGAGGELCVQSPARARSYLDGTPVADAEGWYATGDLGRVDADGAVWITGRRSDRIVSGGVTVDAGEVEEVLRAHPAVHQVCVVGVPDEEWGEVVGAVVVPVEGELDLEEAGAWARSRLSGPKRPRRWVVADVLPLNANGKVDRPRARALLTGGGADR